MNLNNFYYFVYSDYYLHLYCYIQDISALASFGFLQVFYIEFGSLNGTSSPLFNPWWLIVLTPLTITRYKGSRIKGQVSERRVIQLAFYSRDFFFSLNSLHVFYTLDSLVKGFSKFHIISIMFTSLSPQVWYKDISRQLRAGF